MLKEIFHVAVPTAFFNDESLDTKATIGHIENLYNQGVRSVLVCGTTGEQHSQSLLEKITLLEALVNEGTLVSNMEIIFGVSSIRQKEAEELARNIRGTKIAGILLGYSPYIKPSQEEAIEYTKSIVAVSDKPAILYNNPGRTGFDLEVESIVKLSGIQNIIGIKEAGEKSKVSKIISQIDKGKQFHVYAGEELNLEENIKKNGFNRLSSIAGNLAPKEIKAWLEALLTDQLLNESEYEKVADILEKVYQGTPIINLKRELNSRGLMPEHCRKPLGNTS